MNKNLNFMVKVTTLCPGNCKCCKNRLTEFKKIDRDKVIFKLSNFENVCKAVKKVGGKYIALSGGEPTLVNNLSEYVKIANKYGLATRINTSGYNLSYQFLEELLKNGLDQVVLSMYGTTEEIFSKLRGNNLMYKKCICALENIKKLKEKYNFIFILQTVIMKDNYMQMPDLLKIAIKNKADRFWPSYLEDAINLPDARMSEEDINIFNSKIKPKMMDILRSENLLIEKNISNINDIYRNKYLDYHYHCKGYKCPQLGKHLSFYPDGRLDLCCGFEYFEDDKINRIKYDEVEEVVNKNFLESIGKYKLKICETCPQGEHREIFINKNDFDEYSSKNKLVYEK